MPPTTRHCLHPRRPHKTTSHPAPIHLASALLLIVTLGLNSYQKSFIEAGWTPTISIQTLTAWPKASPRSIGAWDVAALYVVLILRVEYDAAINAYFEVSAGYRLAGILLGVVC